ncbi:MAG: nitrous oxide reductase family maturation protein NosD [Betaproteobacteria bacterium]|nr:nitrous oxide reductase family maturation protein NosD [Betaproteobacteria bacterium]
MSVALRRDAGLISRYRWLLVLAFAAAGFARPLGAAPAPPLQPWIDATYEGGTLKVPPGVYSGPVSITRSIVVDGLGKVTVDGGGKGTVVAVRAGGVTLRGLHITNSGGSHDALDSGLLIEKGDGNLIENNVIDDVIFGITLQQANDNRIAGNRVRSRPHEIADRGDGIRLWYSVGNRIEGNDIATIRDITVTNSPRNRFIGNKVSDSRRAMNLLFSHRTLIEGNSFTHNATGITSLNSEGVVIRDNRIMHAMDASGAGIALKESSAALIHRNEIIHCAVGVLADSPLHPINRIALIDNRIAHNITGISFYGERGGHLVLGNRFEHNLWQALVGESGSVDGNEWRGNYWDDYEGFDRDQDGVGDTPYEIWAYADRIWMETPMAKFFRSTPMLELLDFLERLAPFSLPRPILRDEIPQAHSGQRQSLPSMR